MLLIIYMAVMSRMSGGGLWAGRIFGRYDFVPEILFALPIGLLFGLFIDGHFGFVAGYLAALITWLWAYLWMQTGHKDALPWDKTPKVLKDNTLTPVVLWLADRFGVVRGTEAYAWLFMAVKGFLITLPIGGLGFIAWPIGYEIGSHADKVKWIKDPHAVAELSAGGLVGLCGILFIKFMGI